MNVPEIVSKNVVQNIYSKKLNQYTQYYTQCQCVLHTNLAFR